MLYRSTQLPLIERARACNSRWNNFAVFADEIFKNFNIFIIYLFDSLRGKATKLLRLNRGRLAFLSLSLSLLSLRLVKRVISIPNK